MSSDIFTVGTVITVINVAIIAVLVTNIYQSYSHAADINKARTKLDVDFYFLQVFNSMIFLVANFIALYTGVLTYLIHPYVSLDSIVWWRLADRVGMLVVAINLILIRTKYNPFGK